MGAEFLGRLDGQTMCATLALICVLMAALSLGAGAHGQTDDRGALLTWAAAMFLGGLGVCLYLGRGTLPWLLTFHVGNALVVCTAALAWRAFAGLQACGWPRWRIGLPLLFVAIVLAVSAVTGGRHAWVVGLVSIAMACLLAGLARTAAAVAQQLEARTAWITSLGAGSLSLCLAYRAVMAFTPDGERLVSYAVVPNQFSAISFVSLAFAVMGTIGLLGASSELRHRRWHEQMQRDPLTGVLTRAAFFEQAQKIADSGRAYAVLMIDIDHFKSVNDRFGHGAGDAALTQVARRLDASLRAGDLLGRYGGEEFCVLMPGADARTAALTADRVVAEVRRAPLRLAGGNPGGPSSLATTVSVGCATRAETLTEALRWADLALYRAKHAGRNRRSAHWDEPTLEEPSPASASTAVEISA